jgi:hypothetical protein
MENDLMHWLVELPIGGLVVVLWWVFRGVSAKTFDTQEELNKFKLEVTKDFARKDDIKDVVIQVGKSVERIEHTMERFFDLLDRKADK